MDGRFISVKLYKQELCGFLDFGRLQDIFCFAMAECLI
jgi:hypothetical protein